MASRGRGLAPPGPLGDPAGRRREWRAWYAYDWANSAFLTTVGGVLLGPYVTALAERDACGHAGTVEDPCTGSVSVLGLEVAAGSLWLYAVTISTILAAMVLPVIGALMDRVGRKRVVLAGLAWAGSAATCLMASTGGTGWHSVVALGIVAAVCAAAATVAYNSLLNDIAAPVDRDAVSSRGWAAGYLGAGVLLVVNLAYLQFARSRGMDLEEAARVCFVTAGLWWGGWTLWPFVGLSDRAAGSGAHGHGANLATALRRVAGLVDDLRGHPQIVRLLVAYMAYNAAIQVVLASSAVYATRQLGHPQTVVVAALILVQFVAAPGALALGRAADRWGARQVVLGSLLLWALVTLGAALAPAGDVRTYFLLATGTGLVVGGSQALSRSMYSQVIPRGREAEFFGLYQAADRSTSWIGTLAFGLVFQLSGNYRLAMATTAVPFVIGFLLLSRVDLDRGVVDAARA